MKPVGQSLLSKLRWGAENMLRFGAVHSHSKQSGGPDESPIVLNSDEESLTPRLLEWLLRCVFRDPSLYAAALSEFGPELKKCSTISQANAYLLRAAEKPFETADRRPLKASPMDARLRRSITEHIDRVQKNSEAYRSVGFWPDPSSPGNGRSLLTEFPYRLQHKFITRSTPISSAGSCFAVEIAHNLQRAGYNYVVTEPNMPGAVGTGEGAPADSSAAWGIIFNTPSFRQLVERAFGLRELPKILWSGHPHANTDELYMDPFREGVEFRSPEEFADNYDRHVAAACDALMKMRVFIITLGLNEIWTFRMDGSVFSRSPWRIAPSFVEHRTLTVQENVDEMQTMLAVLRRFNPEVKLIVTLSPVPLHATFLHETAHVVEANLHSKSVLRIAAQQFADANQDVFYFPSYELITTGLMDPWESDQRHVKREAVARVMDMFREMYVND
jgi:hypothetical protein